MRRTQLLGDARSASVERGSLAGGAGVNDDRDACARRMRLLDDLQELGVTRALMRDDRQRMLTPHARCQPNHLEHAVWYGTGGRNIDGDLHHLEERLKLRERGRAL